MISERKKYLQQNQVEAEMFFWRTTQQQEIDYIEKQGEQLLAVEFKWNEKAKDKIPVTFTKAYPNAETKILSKEDREFFFE